MVCGHFCTRHNMSVRWRFHTNLHDRGRDQLCWCISVLFKKLSRSRTPPKCLAIKSLSNHGSDLALISKSMITASMYGAMASNIGKSQAVTSSVNSFSVTWPLISWFQLTPVWVSSTMGLSVIRSKNPVSIFFSYLYFFLRCSCFWPIFCQKIAGSFILNFGYEES